MFFIGVTEKGCWSQRPKATESPKMPEVSKVPSTWPLSATSTEPRVTIHKDECSAFTSADQDVIHNIYIYIPIVPHKAVAEVSKIGNL